MNFNKLKQAEEKFFKMYPGGFEHPDMIAIGKKHKMDKMITAVQDEFSEDQFGDTRAIVQAMSKFVSRSSMVSLFEKPKFKEFANSLHNQHETILANGLKEMLHGNQEQGFNMMLDVLINGKMAKWSIISVLPVYHKPYDEVFVKPTTANGVIQQFELDSLVYKPRPSWEFYYEFRSIINEMKSKVDSKLAPNNAAFTGFLMMTMEVD